jgi:hypothetical protein
MKKISLKVLVVLVFSALLLTACGGDQAPVTGEKVEPSKVEPIEGSEYSRLILTEKAVERLDIQTTTVSIEEMNGSQYKVIPYAAVMYGLEGETWAYTNPEALVYVRQSILIDHIDGDLALLTEGPEVGTMVVTVGASMLYGAEVGVSK